MSFLYSWNSPYKISVDKLGPLHNYNTVNLHLIIISGMQHLVILEAEPWGLPLHEKLLPEHLRGLGYRTHAIGKWHLGFHRQEYTPTFRGFDSHYGYYQGFQDYYDHYVKATVGTNFVQW